MPSPFYLGGLAPVRTGWLGPRAVFLDFTSPYTSGWLFQLYAGRRLIGSTSYPTDRRLVGQLVVDDAPCPLTVVRVNPANRLTSFGDLLPEQPWNRYALEWSAAGYPADAHHFELTASAVAGGAVDPSNILALVPFTGNGDYRFQLAPLETAGLWIFRITPRDDALPSGNAGTPADVEIDADIAPADLDFDDDGNRFSVAVAGGELTVSFSY